jgi:hypothetical protein
LADQPRQCKDLIAEAEIDDDGRFSLTVRPRGPRLQPNFEIVARNTPAVSRTFHWGPFTPYDRAAGETRSLAAPAGDRKDRTRRGWAEDASCG